MAIGFNTIPDLPPDVFLEGYYHEPDELKPIEYPSMAGFMFVNYLVLILLMLLGGLLCASVL